MPTMTASTPELPPELLAQARAGDAKANQQLFSLLYEDLKQAARRHLRGVEHTAFSTEGLVHEAYIKLFGKELQLNDRAHFFRLAAQVMKQILIDHIRSKQYQKQGGEFTRVELVTAIPDEPKECFDVLVVEQAIEKLRAVDERIASVVELHLFAGLGMAEIAGLLEVGERTVYRDWRTARALLKLHFDGSL
jgi:RNA polymerase sigma factor (TIGR02999 family)